MPDINAILLVVLGYAIGRSVGHIVQMRSEKLWAESIARLGKMESQFQTARVPPRQH